MPKAALINASLDLGAMERDDCQMHGPESQIIQTLRRQRHKRLRKVEGVYEFLC